MLYSSPTKLLQRVSLVLLTAPLASQSIEPLAITVTGAPEYANPVVPDCSLGWYFDTGMLFAEIGGTVRGYGSNQAAHLIVNGSDINSYVEQAGGADTGLCGASGCEKVKAQPRWLGAYDECGAWLNSVLVEQDNRTVHGFYHSEAMCNYSGGFTNKTMSYALSMDGGLTWAKPSHPDNVILRSAIGNVSQSCAHCTDEGDATVVRHGDWLYMHFMEWNGANGVLNFSAGVSRSHVADAGRPGTWRKYFNGQWMEPSVGGRATAIPEITGSHVYLLKQEDTAVCLGHRQVPLEPDCPTLSWSQDHLSWVQSPEPLWTPLMSEGTSDYPAMTGLRGAEDLRLGETWYEYGTYFPPASTGLDWCTLLFRHPIQTFPAQPFVKGKKATISALQALSLYVNVGKNDTWASTGLFAAMIPVHSGYTRTEEVLVLLMTTNRSEATLGGIPLLDCELGGRHLTASEACPKGSSLQRVLGFVWKSRGAALAAGPDLGSRAKCVPETIFQCARGQDEVLEVGAQACAGASSQEQLGFGYQLWHAESHTEFV